MELTNTHLRYLLAVHELSVKTGAAAPAQVAALLSVSRPSVTRMLGVLADKELVDRERYGKVSLTEQGTLLAERYQDQLHRLAERLPSLGLELTPEETYAAASVLATVLPERCFGRIM